MNPKTFRNIAPNHNTALRVCLAVITASFIVTDTFGESIDTKLQTTTFATVDSKQAIHPAPPEYWANHPSAWQVKTIIVGGMSYTKSQAIYLMQTSLEADKRLTMFKSLACAKLNAMNDKEASDINSTIAQADVWMGSFGNSRVDAHSQAWKAGSVLHTRLDEYNKGFNLSSASR